MAHKGQKVTTDPESKRNPIHEGVGIVTSDSLAAESMKSDGNFGAGNPKAAVSNQPSASTTTNNTDTSNATKLDAAVDAHAREAQEGWNEENNLGSSKGLGKESGVGPTYNTIGSAVNSRGDTRGVTTGTSGGPDGVQGNIAPTAAYAHHFTTGGPKGTDIHEDADLKGETKEGEIGTEMDPGRVAELEYIKRDATSVKVSNRDFGQGGQDSKFSALHEETA
ncbi:hypothetical protein ACN47E_002594 [Coniothyrium glycines]